MDWTENVSVGRNLIVYHTDIIVKGTPDRGCPCGQVLSPLLRYIVVNDLLVDPQKGFHVYGYADNIAV